MIARRASYHGNTLGALDVGGKEPLRRPYAPWLGRFAPRRARLRVPLPDPGHPTAAARGTRRTSSARSTRLGAENVAAFIAEPVAGATLAARRPDRRLLAGRRRGLPPARRAPDRRRGDDGVRPDRALVRHRPLGRAARHPHGRQGLDERLLPVRVRGGERRGVRDRARTGFVHGFTWSHNGARRGRRQRGAPPPARRTASSSAARAWASALLKPSSRPRSATCRDRRRRPRARADDRHRARRDRRAKEPFAAAEQVTERVVAAARERGLLLYSSTGHVDGEDGDLVMLGPPFCSRTRRRPRRRAHRRPRSRRPVRVSGARRRSSCVPRRGSTTTAPSIPCAPSACCSRGT